MHIIESLQKKAKRYAKKLERENNIVSAEEGLEEALLLSAQQKIAIMQIKDTPGFKTIMEYDQTIIEQCEHLLSLDGLANDVVQKTQMLYSLVKGRHQFLNNLQDPK